MLAWTGELGNTWLLRAANGAFAGPHLARTLGDAVSQGNLSRYYRHGDQAGDEVGPARVIPEDGLALDLPHHHVVEDIRGVEARLAGHGGVRLA